MAKDFSYLFYPGDVLRHVQFFTKQQKGCYMEVLCSHIENIRFSYDFLMKITKELNEDDKREFVAIFEQDERGYFLQWVVDSIEKRAAYLLSRSENKKGKKKKQRVKQPKSYDIHMENENKIENKEESKTENKTEKSLHAKFREVFEEIYQHKRELKYIWSAKDGFAMKQLIGKVEAVTDKDEQTQLEFWRTLVEHLPDWYVINGFSPAVINSKFNEIISKINKPHGANNSTVDRQVAEILARGNPYARTAD